MAKIYLGENEIVGSGGDTTELTSRVDNIEEATANLLYDLKTRTVENENNFDNYYTKTVSDDRYTTNTVLNISLGDYYNKDYADERYEVLACSANDLDSRITELSSKVPYTLLKITKTDYDALTTKDENTIYFITE